MATHVRLADVGWVWDGQGINGTWQLSIFGAGEGTRWFGLRRCCFMFHPNTPLAMEKLRGLDEVVCDISKWDGERVEHPQYPGLGAPMRNVHDGTMARKVQEAENVSRLSLDFPNVTGAFDDDLYGKIAAEHITPAQYGVVHQAVKRHNPKTKHWGVVYTHELKPENWRGFEDTLDVVNLWVWDSKNLFRLDEDLERCRAIFPGKPTRAVPCRCRPRSRPGCR
ncbi:MAG: hypothetical protein A3K19_24550 [Lentisphaerae bacterium RIFOXYB12_FULL_65_16]|nr:MAG: hypothetical protein A3K18_17405 [Lentisphaerae bacterium RIFOXYA12_64_32]OGV83981.1 MAG: hypothetical protein A3K19_24550 [Lentisphaerae bacterium RIFOXYB12_FULL_65_16]